jgi:hypothetical protein
MLPSGKPQATSAAIGSKAVHAIVGIVVPGAPFAKHVQAPVVPSHRTRYELPSGQLSITAHGVPWPVDGIDMT